MTSSFEPNLSGLFADAAITTFVLDGEADVVRGEPDLRRLLELACDWYWTLDHDLRLVRLDGRKLDDGPSPMSGEIGRTPWEWSGMLVDTPEFAQLRRALLDHLSFYELQYTSRNAHGHLRYLVISGEPVFADGRFIGFQGTTRDVTSRRRADALVSIEHAVTRSLAEADTSRKILQAVMKVVCESEQWETGGYFRVEDVSGTTRLLAGWSGPGMGKLAIDYYKSTAGKVIPAGGMLSKVIATGKPLWVSEMKEGQTAWAQRVASTGERATIFFPVLVAGNVVGVFAFASREIRQPDERFLKTMRVVGEQVGQFMRRKEAEQVLRESEARFRALTNLSSDWYWEMDAECRLTRIEGRDVGNASLLPGTQSIGRRHWETGLVIDDTGGWDAHRSELEAHRPFRDVVMTHRQPSGRTRYVSMSGEPMLDQHGTFVGYRGVGRDISERKEADLRIRHMATHDGLTALPNRALFHELLRLAIRSSDRTGGVLAVLFVDLDRFKRINDRHGHDVGDALLRETGRRLTACVRAGDVVARLGGDEFVVLVQQVERAQDVEDVARAIVASLAGPVVVGGVDLRTTASVGVSLYRVDATDEHELLKHADVAMYAVKRAGKSGFRVYRREAGAPQAG